MKNCKIDLTEPRFSESEVINQKLLPAKNRITLNRWRKKGLIGFLRIGGKVYYTQTQIENFLARCERPARFSATGGAR